MHDNQIIMFGIINANITDKSSKNLNISEKRKKILKNNIKVHNFTCTYLLNISIELLQVW